MVPPSPGRRLATDHLGPRHPDRRPDRVGQDAGWIPGRHRRPVPGPRGRRRRRRSEPGWCTCRRFGPWPSTSPKTSSGRWPRSPPSRLSWALSPPDIRVAVRTGDTTSSQRSVMVRRPPSFVVTTPESLYLLVTSERGREALRTRRDGDRGRDPRRRPRQAGRSPGPHPRAARSPLRSAPAADRPVGHAAPDRDHRPPAGRRPASARGGRRRPSAPRRPRPGAARRRAGSGGVRRAARRTCSIASPPWWPSTAPPWSSSTPGAWPSGWPISWASASATTWSPPTMAACPKTAGTASSRDSGPASCAPWSQPPRSSSGIDIGPVELVCQIGSPRSIATFLQRVGRSNHSRAGTPKGRLYPLTRDELVECAALLAAVRGGPPGRHSPRPPARSTSWPSRSWPRWPPGNGGRMTCSSWSAGPRRIAS